MNGIIVTISLVAPVQQTDSQILGQLHLCNSIRGYLIDQYRGQFLEAYHSKGILIDIGNESSCEVPQHDHLINSLYLSIKTPTATHLSLSLLQLPPYDALQI